jgi:hypothetical protein
MQPNLKHLGFSMLAGTAALAGAGAALSATAAEPSAPAEEPAHPLYRPWSVGLEVGTTGFGAFGSWRFVDHFGARLGGDYLENSQSDQEIHFIHYDTTARALSETLTLDYYPWKQHSFHVSLGMMFNQNELTGTANGSASITLGDRTIDRSGSLHLKVEQQPVNPYLGIGGTFFYFDHAHHWGLNGELGVAYTGEAKVSLTQPGADTRVIDAGLRHEEGAIQDLANKLQWYPVLKIAVTYSF